MYVVSFHFKPKGRLQCCGDVFFDILVTSKGASAFGMLNTFRNFMQWELKEETDIPLHKQ